jgi:hypothetical protein
MIQPRFFGSGNEPGNGNDRRAPARWAKIVMLQLAFFAGVLLIADPASAQTRDSLTDQESELVRFHQALDARIEVFIKAIDRRFAIINGTAPEIAKKSSKEEPEWGNVPTGTPTQLLGDIAVILDEAITNIDNVSSRDEKNPLVATAVRKLTAAAKRYLTQLATLQSRAKDADEEAAIERVAANANQIIEVGTKLPPAPAESDKKKKKP